MRNFIRELKSKEMSISLVLTIVVSILTVIGFPLLPVQLPLFYSLPISEQQLVPTLFIFIVPICMASVILLHSVILSLLSLDEILSKIVRLCALFILFLLLIVYVHTMTLVL